ncbi:MAG: Bifunctional phosphoglucose/phosphomannose isomerase [Candidatus Uhrbacteria bacterium GW2011_GWD2_52_7]|uniref:Bifunctional phosphoglucose/phosphomannose isomerase n=1 Tax=Candidatus Uhrbacteria bacterium GW2011_GWD2_52_7 TaxID=1618989 RepID=A0A0G1XEY6_9BACT|nr:MAG: Bifunctional phosphoglucose/phosphomannose isomerase [Candidatus Uhrbacteria bacterium GW2011_GWD2_52_7]
MHLDSNKTYATLDVSDIRFGIEHLPEQVRLAWEDLRDFVLPAPYARVAHVVLVGMGGSALGARMLTSIMRDRLKVPVLIVNDYTLPGFVGSKSMVILSSFSGTTEEVLAASDTAKASGAKVVVIAAEGELLKRAKLNHWPAYQFHPGDLAKQPRLGVGFSLAGVMGILERARLVKVARAEVDRMCIAMGEVIDACAIDVPSAENPAKIVAKELQGKAVFVIGAEHLVGSAHVFANHLNETSKQFATPFALPEVNHHLLEGLTYPKGFSGKAVALILKSELYGERIQRRCEVTADLLEQQGISVVEYETHGDERLEQAGEVLQFGSFVSYYLAMLNGVRPDSIPFVDEFKARLGKK